MAACGLYAAFTLAVVGAWVIWGDTALTAPVNLTTFWWSLPAVPLVVVAVLFDRRVAVLLAVPALLWVWSYGSGLVGSEPAAAAELRVASYNTFVRAPDTSHVRRLVDTQRPDVLLLQEVFPSRAAALRDQLAGDYPHVHVEATPRVGGVAVFSRHPIAEVRRLGEATERSRSSVVVVLDVDGRRLQVAPVHLLSPCPACGPSLVERSRLVVDVRRAEVAAVLEGLDRSTPAVVGGDFNSNERSEPYRRLVAAGFADPQRDAGSGFGFTWPADRTPEPVVRIDWVLTRGLEPVRAFVPRIEGSDHRPVVVDLAWPEGAAGAPNR